MAPSAPIARRASAQGLKAERLVALFLAGWIAFNPPILGLFGMPVTVFGLPLLYLYLFVGWAGLIALAALIVERRDPPVVQAAPDGSAGEAEE
jgi:hypothetical protein